MTIPDIDDEVIIPEIILTVPIVAAVPVKLVIFPLIIVPLVLLKVVMVPAVPVRLVIIPEVLLKVVMVPAVPVRLVMVPFVEPNVVIVPTPAFTFPLNVVAVMTPVTLTSPITSSFDVGFVDPIPRLPET